MLTRSTLLHLRLPFSWFLLPTYLLAICCARDIVMWKAVLIFFILHFLLYPASNAYNSYYDRDTDSIGTLKNPPPVEKQLHTVSVMMDVLAVLAGLFIGWIFAAAALIYGLCSKAYSNDKIRFKRKPVLGLLGVGLVQGGLTFLMSYYGVQDIRLEDLLDTRILSAAAISGFFLTAAYPMTQIYQHKADGEKGDISFSLLLGIRGTFIFCALFLALAIGGFTYFFRYFFSAYHALIFSVFTLPVGLFFLVWMVESFHDPGKADYDNTMRLNTLSSTALNLCFLFFIIHHHIISLGGM
jgi:4-hydroxybenzoate polyprenyltransferase